MSRTTTSIKFSTAAYEASHRKAPRGRGHWAFCPAKKARTADYLRHTIFVGGFLTLADAKKAAASSCLLPAGWRGTLEVMP